MKKAQIIMTCDAPGCDSKIVLPLGRDGQAFIQTTEQQEEVDRWTSIHRNDGSVFDYCRPVCHKNGIETLAPINRNPVPEMSNIVGADGAPLSCDGGLIIP